jgi:hypothetical protein
VEKKLDDEPPAPEPEMTRLLLMMPNPPPARKRDLFLLARLITILSICH